MQLPSVYEFLKAKRNGRELDSAHIDHFIRQFVAGEIADYQMTAFLMAVAIRGMTAPETVALTQAMLSSGEQWKLREAFEFVADKHSSGGVGDKVSLALAPWVAACGVNVAMLSGRGLGHTGGTLDKLEAIPGFNARLSRQEMERCIAEAGCVIATSTSRIAPADRRMYSLRDVTATVDSLPLITASIMSKKLALGASALILDVKFGSGAFMETVEDARALAHGLVAAAKGSGTKVEALLTSMEQPLGIAVGNSNEVIEAFGVLRGRAPADLVAVTKAQSLRILVMSGRFDESAAAKALDDAISSGSALRQARKWVAAQGGSVDFIDDPKQLPQPRSIGEITAARDGFITGMDTRAIGLLSVDLGAGRHLTDDEIDHSAGLMIERKVGDEVRRGDVIARAYIGAKDADEVELNRRYNAALTVGPNRAPEIPLVGELITA